MTDTYNEPVSKLLSFGDADWDEWDDYSEFGFTKEHIPELIRLGTDRHLLVDIEDVDDYELWSPMHAWRILARTQAEEAISPLAQVLDWSEASDSDLINEGLTDVFEEFGEPAIEPLTKFINEAGHSEAGYIGASEVMARIAKRHPECRERVVENISSALNSHFTRNDEEVNGFWLADLLDLKAVESYPVIKKAFDAKKINVRVAGDLEDVEIEFGMRTKRDTPPPNLPLPLNFMRSLREEDGFQFLGREVSMRQQEKARKEKNKRKQEKKSRKKNRKRK